VSQTISVPGRFNGPLGSGQGGYTAGLIASFVKSPAEVTLRSPVPLDTQLDVRPQDDGSPSVLDGETLIAQGRPAHELKVEVPATMDLDEARAASERYRGAPDGLFGRCFVCGGGREDALGVFAGPVAGRDLAAVYTGPELPVSFLGRLTVRINATVRAGEEHVVIAWPMEADGRKRHAGAALLSPDGAPLAIARALMIEPREESPK
jgi:hypothetical protein